MRRAPATVTSSHACQVRTLCRPRQGAGRVQVIASVRRSSRLLATPTKLLLRTRSSQSFRPSASAVQSSGKRIVPSFFQRSLFSSQSSDNSFEQYKIIGEAPQEVTEQDEEFLRNLSKPLDIPKEKNTGYFDRAREEKEQDHDKVMSDKPKKPGVLLASRKGWDSKKFTRQIQFAFSGPNAKAAMKLFDDMKKTTQKAKTAEERNKVAPTVFTYNTLLAGLAKKDIERRGKILGERKDQISFSDNAAALRPQRKVLPRFAGGPITPSAEGDAATTERFPGGERAKDLKDTERTEEELFWKVLDEMKSSGEDGNTITYNILIDYLGKLGRIEEMKQVWDSMLARKLEPSERTFSSLLAALGKSGRIKDLESVYIEAKKRNLDSNPFIKQALLAGLANSRQFDLAYQMLTEMKQKGTHNRDLLSAYNALINALGKSNKMGEAVQLFEQLRSNWKQRKVEEAQFEIDEEKKSSTDEAKDEGKEQPQQEESTVKSKLGPSPDVITYSSLINGFSNNNTAKAIEYFNQMKLSGIKADRILYSTMIDSCIKAKMPNEAIVLYKEMRDAHLKLPTSVFERLEPILNPDQFTFPKISPNARRFQQQQHPSGDSGRDSGQSRFDRGFRPRRSQGIDQNGNTSRNPSDDDNRDDGNRGDGQYNQHNRYRSDNRDRDDRPRRFGDDQNNRYSNRDYNERPRRFSDNQRYSARSRNDGQFEESHNRNRDDRSNRNRDDRPRRFGDDQNNRYSNRDANERPRRFNGAQHDDQNKQFGDA